ncbi:hypothetical protein CROQUDRAFT_92887 [Cronartium quercuum f. sp. fusiforme G11]|uniref:Uncharacterized protein n=1 Tax=Cronartium quercuum f. sp. fusiforme G11 TaxID=708437 RepID=A0A9P6NML6_9BASI|nr:hypothetical protein CROQUDRAFT_92887 [Cronartium quercuum f. sp. fusiforme G11]
MSLYGQPQDCLEHSQAGPESFSTEKLSGPAFRVFETQLGQPRQLSHGKALGAGLKRGGNKAGPALHKSFYAQPGPAPTANTDI